MILQAQVWGDDKLNFLEALKLNSWNTTLEIYIISFGQIKKLKVAAGIVKNVAEII